MMNIMDFLKTYMFVGLCIVMFGLAGLIYYGEEVHIPLFFSQFVAVGSGIVITGLLDYAHKKHYIHKLSDM